MLSPGEVISYLEMCREEGASLQRGMNYRFKGADSVILMSIRKGAPYVDRIEQDGRILIYEGHDVPRTAHESLPKRIDQPLTTPSGKPTQNGLFFEAAMSFKRGDRTSEIVKVYEKIRDGIWVFDGLFHLIDAWQEESGQRKVFKFKLQLSESAVSPTSGQLREFEHGRLIPSSVKLEVWKRDKGRCVLCGSDNNLHYDHDLPFSKGGSSILAKNIRLLCARHNLAKHDKIE